MISFDHTNGEQTWITPPSLQQSLGHFDLDPCAADDMPYKTADRMITKAENGLACDWGDCRVWLNPPYGKEIVPFLERMRRGIALLASRTDSKWFHNLIIPRCAGVYFLRRRVRFIDKFGNVGGQPAFASILVGYTKEDVELILHSGLEGTMMEVSK